MRKYFIAFGALVALAVPSSALADNTNNPSTKDAHGYATANAVVNIVKEGEAGVTFEQRGLGQFRSQETGAQVSAIGGHRGEALYPDWITDQGYFGPISNNTK
jgi:hypothetical protein